MTKQVMRLALVCAVCTSFGLAGTAVASQTNVPFEVLSLSASKPTKATKKKPRMVTIRWRTTTEVEADIDTVLGFTLYREVAKKRVKLNRVPIALKGSITGATYTWIDKLPKTVKGSPCYRLEALSGGKRTFLKRACSKR